MSAFAPSMPVTFCLPRSPRELGLDTLAYRLYARMIDELAGALVPERLKARGVIPRPLG